MININTNINTQEEFTFKGNTCLAFTEFKYFELNAVKRGLYQEYKKITNYLYYKLPVALNRAQKTLTPGRIRAILWQAEAIAASSDRENLVIINRFECFYRYFLSNTNIWNITGKLSDHKLTSLHKKFQQKKLTREDYRLLETTAKEVQSNYFIGIFKQERQRNTDLVHDLYDDIKKLEQGLPKKYIPFFYMAFQSYFRYITKLNNLTVCAELAEYATYRNCFCLKTNINISYIKASIIFKEYISKQDSGHQFIVIIDISDFFNVKQQEYNIRLEQGIECKKSYSELERTTFENKLYPPIFKNITAAIADPWIQRSEQMTKSNWLKYLKNIACELDIHKFKDLKFVFLPFYIDNS
jgi:hypothetical protein